MNSNVCDAVMDKYRHLISHVADMERLLLELKTILPAQETKAQKHIDNATELQTACNYLHLHFQDAYKQMNDIKCETCEHQFVFDLVDIDPDRSAYVKYCELCYKTENVA